MDQRSSILSGEHKHIHAPVPHSSLLRISVPTRLAIVGAISALLWAFVWLWALR